jgi:hypothetical protein
MDPGGCPSLVSVTLLQHCCGTVTTPLCTARADGDELRSALRPSPAGGRVRWDWIPSGGIVTPLGCRGRPRLAAARCEVEGSPARTARSLAGPSRRSPSPELAGEMAGIIPGPGPIPILFCRARKNDQRLSRESRAAFESGERATSVAPSVPEPHSYTAAPSTAALSIQSAAPMGAVRNVFYAVL